MKIIRKREIFVERERSVTFRFANVQPPRFCGECQAESRFVTVDEAAIARQTTSRQIYRLVENSQIHHAETSEGFLLICFASIEAAAKNQIQLTK